MAIVQVTLDDNTDAELAYLAKKLGRPRGEILNDLIRTTVSQKFNEMINQLSPPLQTPKEPRVPLIKRGRGGHPVIYVGDDPKLQKGKTYNSYVEVARIVIPDKLGLLWNRKKGTGDNAKNLLKRHALSIYKDLIPQ